MDEQQLRQAILANPQEDAPRLAYAAWCEAQGEKARAAYIRAAIAWARVDRHSAQADQLFQEELHALWARPKGTDWHPAFTAIEARYKAKIGSSRSLFMCDDIRGFTGSVSGLLPDVLAILPEACTVEPIEQLGLRWEGGTGERESPEDAPNLAQMPTLLNIRSLYLPADVELIRALGSSAFLIHLERLRIGRAESETRPLDVEAFLTALLDALAQGFASVRRLEITGVPFPAPSVARLCTSKSAWDWQRLGIERAELHDAGAKTLAAAMPLQNIHDLWLRDNAITADGLSALLNSPALANVRDLDLGKNTIDEPGMKAIIERKSMNALARLGLEESVHHRVFADWTDWTGANIGGDYETQTLEPKEVAAKYPLPGIALYKLRHE